MEEIQRTTISNEDTAIALLEQAISEAGIDSRLRVSFDDWPTLNFKFTGDDFNGGLPSRMLEPFHDLQKIIYRVYCHSKYGHTDTRSLSASEKESLDFVLYPSEGSTDVLIKLAEVFERIIEASDMSGKQVMVTVVSLGIIIASSYSWVQWLNHKREIHNSSNIQILSQQETERLKIVTNAISAAPALSAALDDIDSFRGSLARKLRPDDEMFVGGSMNTALTNGEEAAEIIPSTRKKSVDGRVDGEFIISEVKIPRTEDDPFVFSVLRTDDGLQLRVEATSNNLTMDQIDILKEGTFDRRKVVMSINVKKVGDRYIKASLYSLSWPED